MKSPPAMPRIVEMIRVSTQMQADRDGARAALMAWARSRPGGQCQRADWCCKPNRHRGACLRRAG